VKITKKVTGYTIRLSDSEMALLEIMVSMAEADQKEVWSRANTYERKSYSRRCGPKGRGKPFLRVDLDKRKW
jgi:hypothetical protein